MGRVSITSMSLPQGMPVPRVNPYRRALADDLLATDVTLVTVQKLLGHALVQTMAQYDQWGNGPRSRRWGRCRCRLVSGSNGYRYEKWSELGFSYPTPLSAPVMNAHHVGAPLNMFMAQGTPVLMYDEQRVAAPGTPCGMLV